MIRIKLPDPYNHADRRCEALSCPTHVVSCTSSLFLTRQALRAPMLHLQWWVTEVRSILNRLAKRLVRGGCLVRACSAEAKTELRSLVRDWRNCKTPILWKLYGRNEFLIALCSQCSQVVYSAERSSDSAYRQFPRAMRGQGTLVLFCLSAAMWSQVVTCMP